MRIVAVGGVGNEDLFCPGSLGDGDGHQPDDSDTEDDHRLSFDPRKGLHSVRRVSDRIHKCDDLLRNFSVAEEQNVSGRKYDVLGERAVVMQAADHGIRANMIFSKPALRAFSARDVHFRRRDKIRIDEFDERRVSRHSLRRAVLHEFPELGEIFRLVNNELGEPEPRRRPGIGYPSAKFMADRHIGCLERRHDILQ